MVSSSTKSSIKPKVKYTDPFLDRFTNRNLFLIEKPDQ